MKFGSNSCLLGGFYLVNTPHPPHEQGSHCCGLNGKVSNCLKCSVGGDCIQCASGFVIANWTCALPTITTTPPPRTDLTSGSWCESDGQCSSGSCKDNACCSSAASTSRGCLGCSFFGGDCSRCQDSYLLENVGTVSNPQMDCVPRQVVVQQTSLKRPDGDSCVSADECQSSSCKVRSYSCTPRLRTLATL